MRSILVLTVHAFAVWALCGATMAIGMKIASLRTALIVHAVAAPLFATTASLVYFSKFGDATPVVTACFFVGLIIVLDFFLVALVINRSLEMFRSVLGTWLPFLLIFSSTLVTGLVISRPPK